MHFPWETLAHFLQRVRLLIELGLLKLQTLWLESELKYIDKRIAALELVLEKLE